MESLVNYIGENQGLFIVLGISIVISTILLYAIYLLSRKKEDSYDDEFEVSEEKKEKEDIVVKPVEVHEEPVSKATELDILLEQMQKDLEDEKENPTLSFEKEQEENAIISYEELLRASKKEPLLSLEEEENQPMIMSVKEYEKLHMAEPSTTEPTFEEVTIPSNEPKKFKNSEFISPIYGKINTNLEYPKIPSFQKAEERNKPQESVLEDSYLPPLTETLQKEDVNRVEVEHTLDLDQLVEEMKKNEEFLQALKEFRNNL